MARIRWQRISLDGRRSSTVSQFRLRSTIETWSQSGRSDVPRTMHGQVRGEARVAVLFDWCRKTTIVMERAADGQLWTRALRGAVLAVQCHQRGLSREPARAMQDWASVSAWTPGNEAIHCSSSSKKCKVMEPLTLDAWRGFVGQSGNSTRVQVGAKLTSAAR
jgi:hypothetical protein